MYDWANSVYSLVITSSLFPVFYGMVALGKDGSKIIHFFGYPVLNSALFSFSVSFSFLLGGFASPILTALADLGDYRKQFLRIFCLVGSLSCIGLAFFSSNAIELGMLIFVLATFGYSASIVFYNSYLPYIASPDQLDKVSARGFAMGYIGSVILLVFILIPVLIPTAFSWLQFSFVDICRAGFVMTGIWWMGFGLRSIAQMPDSPEVHRIQVTVKKVFGRFRAGLAMVGGIPGLFRFLMGLFWFNTGVQTIMYLAAIFGSQELQMSAEKLILTILILQLVAIAGARGFAFLAEKQGSVMVLLQVGFLWILATISAYFIQTDIQFYLLASLVGLVMGGTQSLFRSVFSGFLPEEENAKSALFGLFDFLEKTSTVMGTLVFGLVNQATGNMRLSALTLGIFFLLGIAMLWPLRNWRHGKVWA